MSTHTTKVIETKELSDESVSYLIRCCDDTTTDSWHTFTVSANTLAEINAQIEDRKAGVAAKHEAKLQWRQSVKDSEAAATR